MRKLSCFVVATALCGGPALGWEAAADGGRPRAFVNGNGDLNLRAWPAPQSQLLVKIPQNTRVEADRCIHPEKVQGNWCHVRFGGYVGWVDAAFLQKSSGGYAGPSPPVATPLPPPVVVAPPSLATAQQRLRMPPEFVGRWATVYIPLCAAIPGGCSSERAFLPVVTVIAPSGDSWAEPDEGKHFPMTVYPDPGGRAGYYKVVEDVSALGIPGSENIWRVYRYGDHTYRESVAMHPPPHVDGFEDLLRESGMSDEQIRQMAAAPQMSVECRLRPGSNAECE